MTNVEPLQVEEITTEVLDSMLAELMNGNGTAEDVVNSKNATKETTPSKMDYGDNNAHNDCSAQTCNESNFQVIKYGKSFCKKDYFNFTQIWGVLCVKDIVI